MQKVIEERLKWIERKSSTESLGKAIRILLDTVEYYGEQRAYVQRKDENGFWHDVENGMTEIEYDEGCEAREALQKVYRILMEE